MINIDAIILAYADWVVFSNFISLQKALVVFLSNVYYIHSIVNLCISLSVLSGHSKLLSSLKFDVVCSAYFWLRKACCLCRSHEKLWLVIVLRSVVAAMSVLSADRPITHMH